MNHMMEHLFPELAQVASFMFDNDFGPKMKKQIMSKSDKVKDVKFSQFKMGTVPPKFEKLQVTNLPGGICKVRVWGDYMSDLSVLVTLNTTLGEFQCGFKNLQISGDMVIICNPYEEANPGTASMSCYFVEVPSIDFDFAGTVAFINSLGIKDIFIKMAASALEKKVVLPNMATINVQLLERRVYPLVFEQPDPMGMLRVRYKKGGLTKQKKAFTVSRAFENAFEYVDNQLGKMMGKDMSEYLQITLGEMKWEPNLNHTDVSSTFVVVDPQQRLHLSVWDRDLVGADDLMASAGPYHLDVMQNDFTGKPVVFKDDDQEEYASCNFEFEWLNLERGQVGEKDSMVIASIRELTVHTHLESTRKLAVRGKLLDAVKTSHQGSILKHRFQDPKVQHAMQDVKECLTENKVDSTVIEQVMQLLPKNSRISINSSIHLIFPTEKLRDCSLELSVVEFTKNGKTTEETIVAQTLVKMAELKASPNMNMPDLMQLTGSIGKIDAEIDLSLCGLVPGKAPAYDVESGRPRMSVVHYHLADEQKTEVVE